ncbi:MAG: hypothetical protein ACWGQW_01310 [bacterium]
MATEFFLDLQEDGIEVYPDFSNEADILLTSQAQTIAYFENVVGVRNTHMRMADVNLVFSSSMDFPEEYTSNQEVLDLVSFFQSLRG